METIGVVLILLFTVVVSDALTHMSPIAIPRPLVQIALGATIAVFADFRIDLQPDIFFLLFLPPLLFLDGWRMSKERLLRDKNTIVQLALGLVVFTVVGVGFFVHWMIPLIPLAVAFALAAVISPTDAVAVSAIAARAPIPRRLMGILEGEALLNDASGLVCMRFAVAAAMTGVFSPLAAVATFLWLAAGGLIVGVGATFCATFAKGWVARRFGEESGSEILISLLIPFAAYLVAEAIDCSGILAVVAAGVAMSYVERGGQALAATRMRRMAVWDAVAFAANGTIFVLLGQQLPRIATGAAEVVLDTGHHQPIWLLIYVFAITLALAILRLIWVWVSVYLTLMHARTRGRKRAMPSWRLIVAISLAGVRGAVTLAGVLTLPITLESGIDFPARALAIFLAAGVILVSLIAASLGLPHLLKDLNLPPEPSTEEEEDKARIAAAEAAIQAIERALHERGTERSDIELYTEAGARIMAVYRQRIEGRSKGGKAAARARKSDEIERRLSLLALRAERSQIYALARSRKLSDDTARRLVRDIDLSETRLSVM